MPQWVRLSEWLGISAVALDCFFDKYLEFASSVLVFICYMG